MQQIIAGIAARLDLDEAKTQKAVGLMLAFLKKEGPPDEVNRLLAALPGSEILIAQTGSAGLFGMGGLMGLGGQLMGAGLSMSQVQTLSRALFEEGRKLAGEETMGEIVSGIPGLSQFV